MGYSRGSRPGPEKPKTCSLCETTFPDAQERKKHYKHFNCRDDLGNLGGFVVSGNCRKMEPEVEIEDLPPLFEVERTSYGDGYENIVYGPAKGYVNPSYYEKNFCNYICDYVSNQAWSAERDPLNENPRDWDILLANAKYDENTFGLGYDPYIPPNYPTESDESCDDVDTEEYILHYMLVERVEEKQKEETPICCSRCFPHGMTCADMELLAEDYMQWVEEVWDLFERCGDYQWEREALLSCKSNIGSPKLGLVWEEVYYFPSYTGKMGYNKNVLLKQEVLFRVLPFIGKSVFQVLEESRVEVTGDLLFDVERALDVLRVEFQKESSHSATSFFFDGVAYEFVFEDWRDELSFILINRARKGNWKSWQQVLHAVHHGPLFFLAGFPAYQISEQVESSGFNPFSVVIRKFSKQATLGFLDGLFAKIKECFSSVIEAAGIFWHCILEAKKKLVDWISTCLTENSAVFIECAIVVVTMLMTLGMAAAFYKFANAVRIGPYLIVSSVIALLTYFFHRWMEMPLERSAGRSQLVWDLIIAESQEEKVKANKSLHEVMVEALGEDASDLFVDVDLNEEEKVEPSGFDTNLDTSLIWKLMLLIVPTSTIGLKSTVALAKDVSILQGGKESAARFFRDIVGGIQELYYTLTGKKAQFLGYIYSTVGVDFEGWRTKVLELTTATQTSIFVRPDERIKMLRALKDEADKLITQMDSRKVPGAYITQFNILLAALDKALVEVNQALAVGQWRVTPAVIWLYGESHVGKSVCSQYLIDDILNEMDYPETGRVFARNGADSFFSCYKNQVAILYDDFGAVQEGNHFDEAELIRLVAPTPYPLNMPNLEAKGNTCCTSEFVFVTANQPGLTPGAQVHCQAAFENRRLIMANVTAVPGGKYRDRYRFTLRSVNDPYPTIPGTESMNYDEFMNFCVRKCRDHFDEQKDLSKAPHAHIFSAGREIAENFSAELQNFNIPIPAENWISYCSYTKVLKWFDAETLKERTTVLEQDRGFTRWLDLNCNPQAISHQFQQKLSKAAYKNMVNCFGAGKNPFVEHGAHFQPSKVLLFLSRSMEPKVLEEDIQREKQSFVQVLKEWKDYAVQEIADMPITLKVVLGFAALYFVGMPCLKFLCSLFKSRSVGDVIACGVVAAGSLASSGDLYTRRNKSGRERRRYIMEASSAGILNGQSQNIESAIKRISAHILGFSSAADKRIRVRALALGGTSVLFVYHTWLEMEKGLYKVSSIERTFSFVVRPEKCKVQRLGLKDLVVVSFPPSFVPFPKLSLDLFPAASDPITPGFGMFMEVNFDDKGIISIVREDADYSLVDSHTTYDSALLRGIGLNRHFRYQIPEDEGEGYNQNFFYKSQCGTILVGHLGKKGGIKIFSLHVAHFLSMVPGKGRKATAGAGSMCTKEELEEAILATGGLAHTLQDDILEASGSLSGLGFEEAETLFPLGICPLGKTPPLPSTSSIHPSMIQEDVLKEFNEKIETEPAILNNGDLRIPKEKEVDIFKKGMLKYKEAADDFSPIDEAEDLNYQEITDEVFSYYQDFRGEIGVLSERENLNGIPGEEYFRGVVVSTSEGWPYILERKGDAGKARYLDGLPGNYCLGDTDMKRDIAEMEAYLDCGIPSIVGLDTPKDERLPKRKIYDDPKTRLFTILPFSYNYLVRKYFGAFVFKMMEAHNEVPVKVGINPLGEEWTLLAKQMYGMGNNWFNGDYSRFDGITPRFLLVEIAQRISKIYGDDFATRRLHLMLACTTRLGIAGRGLYRVTGGIPSGFALTVIVNSLVNHWFMRWAWSQLCPNLCFREHVCIAVYGDDNLVSVSEQAMERYNLCNIARALKKKKITLTDGSNKELIELPKFNDPEKCDFLKRTFKRWGDRFLAPLGWSSLKERLLWVRMDNLTNEAATALNCKDFLAELFHYGDKEKYVLWHQGLRDICQRSRIKLEYLPTFAEQERMWLSGSALADIEEKPILVKISPTCTNLTPDCAIYPCNKAGELLNSEAQIVWCGPNCPEALRRKLNVQQIAAPAGYGFPYKNLYRKKCQELRRRASMPGANGKVYFLGAFDQALVHFCAAFYCAMYYDFSFHDYIGAIYLEKNEKQYAAIVKAYEGW